MARNITKGSGNVFADINASDPQGTQVRADLMIRIQDLIEERELTQRQAAKILDVSQPRVSDLVNGQLDKFSLQMLLEMLNKLDRDIEILVRPIRGKQEAGIRVSLVMQA